MVCSAKLLSVSRWKSGVGDCKEPLATCPKTEREVQSASRFCFPDWASCWWLTCGGFWRIILSNKGCPWGFRQRACLCLRRAAPWGFRSSRARAVMRVAFYQWSKTGQPIGFVLILQLIVLKGLGHDALVRSRITLATAP
jgi:hypothetical protein